MSAPDSSHDFGQGQSIGIIGEGQTVDVIAALREFEKTRGLPQVPVQVYHTDVGTVAAESSLDDSGRIEWEMDTQASTGMAPEVSQLRMYFGSSLALTELSGAIGTWVNDSNGPLQTSASLGACEDNPAIDPLFGAAQRADQAFLAQAAMEGRSFFASAGDTGARLLGRGLRERHPVRSDPGPRVPVDRPQHGRGRRHDPLHQRLGRQPARAGLGPHGRRPQQVAAADALAGERQPPARA